MILGRGAHHGRATNINIFDGVLQRAVRAGNGGLEGIQIHDDQINSRDIVLIHHRIINATPA